MSEVQGAPMEPSPTVAAARVAGILTELIEEEGILVFLHVLCGAGLVQEEGVYTFDVVHLHLCALGTGGTQLVSARGHGSDPPTPSFLL